MSGIWDSASTDAVAAALRKLQGRPEPKPKPDPERAPKPDEVAEPAITTADLTDDVCCMGAVAGGKVFYDPYREYFRIQIADGSTVCVGVDVAVDRDMEVWCAVRREDGSVEFVAPDDADLSDAPNLGGDLDIDLTEYLGRWVGP